MQIGWQGEYEGGGPKKREEKIECFSKEIKDIEKNQIEILKLKSTMIEIKNTARRWAQQQNGEDRERISELENRISEITQSEQQ